MGMTTPRAFVLSGGATLGPVQVGMVGALYARGIRPDLFVGCSVGAINAAFLAAHPPTAATVAALAARWLATRRASVFPFEPLTSVRALVGRGDHLVPPDGLRAMLAADLAALDFEDLPVALHVVAVDVVTGDELRLGAGPVLDAVMASTAVPGLLPPVERDGRWLVDGAVADNTPISHAVALGARDIYVLPTGHACALARPPRSAVGAALQALTLLTHNRLVTEIEHHRSRAHGDVRLVVLPPPCPLAVSPLDFSQAQRLIDRARHDAEAFLDGGGADRAPVRMRAHRHDSASTGKTSAAPDAHRMCPPLENRRHPTPTTGASAVCSPPASPRRWPSVSRLIPGTTSTR